MKRMTGRLAALALAALCSASLAACAPSGSKPSAQQSSAAAGQTEPASAQPTASAAAAQDPLGKYDQTVTIRVGAIVSADTTFPDGETAEDNRYTRLVKDKLNIVMETMWQVGSGADFAQKMNLAIASNELPDATVVSKVQFRAMAKSNQLEELGPVIEAYGSDMMKAYLDTSNGDALKAATYDGKVQGLPNVQADADGYHLLWVRKDWLDKLNLKVPTTVEEVKTVAKAFVDNKMAGSAKTIGLSGPQSGGKLYATFLESSNNTFGFDPIFSARHSYPGYWYQKDGAITYGSIQPETKQALSDLRDMYAAGVIDQEMGVRADAAEPVVSGQTGMFFGPWWIGYWPLPDALKNDPDANWQAYAVPLDDQGSWTPHVAATTGMFTVVRKGYEHPEAIVKLANLAIISEPTMDTSTLSFSFFPLRNTMGPTNEVQVTTTLLRKYLAGEVTADDLQKELGIYVGLKTDLDTVKAAKKEPYTDMNITNWDISNENFPRLYSMLVGAAPLIDTKAAAVSSVVYDQTDMMMKKWSTLKKLEDETFLKIITGSSPLDSFDDFVAQWKQQGGDDILKELASVTQ